MLEFFSSDEETTARKAAMCLPYTEPWEWENQFLPGLLFRL